MLRDHRAVGSGIRVQAVGEQQVPAVAAFQTACWQQAYRGIVPGAYLDAMNLERRTAGWRERVVSGLRHVVGAWDGEAVVGVVSWTTTGLPNAADELNTLYVDAAQYGSGLADDLLDVAVGAKPARLWVFEANHRARRFYARHGFLATGAAQIDPGTGVHELELARTSAPATRGSSRVDDR